MVDVLVALFWIALFAVFAVAVSGFVISMLLAIATMIDDWRTKR